MRRHVGDLASTRAKITDLPGNSAGAKPRGSGVSAKFAASEAVRIWVPPIRLPRSPRGAPLGRMTQVRQRRSLRLHS